MKTPRFLLPAATAGVLALTLTACGGGGGGGTTGGGSDAEANLEGRGPITYVQGKDNSNVVRPLLDKWNAAHPDEQVTFKEQTDQADQQHDDLVQNFQAKNENYDVVSVDVVWTAEFAARGWLQPLEGNMAIETDGMLEPTIEAGSYQDKLYTAPVSSDGGILYYRKDLVPEAPKTWDEMMGMCSIAKENNIGCYAGQFKQYEGLTVNASEAINSAGGSVLGDDGKPNLTTPEAEEGLNNLVDAFKNGNIPAEAITYQEEESRRAFQEGKLLFLRNWPYVYNLATTEGSSQVKDVLGMAALPGKDGPGASSLGGHNAAISVYSKNKATALDFVKFLIEEEQQKFFATQGSLAPVLGDLYEDQELVAKLPYLPVLKTSIENAVPRPVTPFYPAVTQAIQENSYAALKGEKSAEQALADMQKSIESAGAGS
ncbi:MULTISPECIES: ABC transporter substrate-binding protein [Pseudarthrobacter]|jgi:multiple sugar transport system substrate-binding protein|uniref:Multiple sugar transport system substrate-binding protein n=1 Tax=Pseudarthrobacter oxydans TaxID=1671 RepID=A0AAW8NC89_PSEOX|nr:MULTISPECIES: ABC transporter substrate-binding protein [Pseudarthrobacter]MBA4100632.1 ABC transporter substrate-binding protein [Arthrobacter sp.]MDR6792763.1 multiple sugar transport system substrate-binding protein [Pseudarthrobacter oxydans]MDR7163979.1 multiple sugar transport system substrate-binding protein [Pseudarthrobacter oxydans]NSX37547.1 ABC transporter substrate-binding protein [Pseudarthrobacter oxydans]BFE43042.1 ABC transporter substrate-binding protein [Pseudarthrobacter